MGERTWWQAVSASVVERWTIAGGPATTLAEFERRARDRRVVNRRFVVKRRGGAVRVSNGAVTADVSARAEGATTEVTVWIDSLGWSYLGSGIARLLVGLLLLAVTAGGGRSSTAGGWFGSVFGNVFGSLGGFGGGGLLLFAVPGLMMMFSGFSMLVALPGFPPQRQRMLRRVAEVLVGMGATFHAEPGWYPAPDGRPVQRWWDGAAWTVEERPAPDDEARLNRRIVFMQFAVVPVFFAGLFGIFVLPALLSGSGSSSSGGTDIATPVQIPRPPTVPPTAAPDPTVATAIGQVAEARLRQLFAIGSDSELRVRVGSEPCPGCLALEVSSGQYLDPVVAKIALGPGELTARPVASPIAACVPYSDVTWTSVPWIRSSPVTYQCASVDPSVATLTAAQAGITPVPDAPPGLTGLTAGAVTLRLHPSPELATWVTAHAGQSVALVLDGAVIAELDSASAGAAALGFPVVTPPLGDRTDRAVVLALLPPPMPR